MNKSELGDALTWGGLMIGVGVIAFMNTLGVLPTTVWLNFMRFWPVIFILIGINIIFNHYGKIASLIGGLINLLIIAVIGFISIVGLPFLTVNNVTTESKITTAEIGTTTPTNRNVKVSLNASELTLTDDLSGNDHIYLKAEHAENQGKPRLTSAVSGTDLSIELSNDDGINFLLGSVKQKYQVQLGQPDLKTNLRIESNASQNKIELQKQKLGNLTIDANAAQTEVTLKSATNLPAEISAEVNAGNLILRLPITVKLKIDYEANIGNIRIDGRTLQGEGQFNEDGANLTLKLSANAGNVEIYRNQTDVPDAAIR